MAQTTGPMSAGKAGPPGEARCSGSNHSDGFSFGSAAGRAFEGGGKRPREPGRVLTLFGVLS